MNADTDLIEQMQALRRDAQPFAMVTVVRCKAPTSAKPGAKALVLADGSIHGWIGGGCAQPTVRRIARRAIDEGKPFLLRLTPEGNAAEEENFVECAMSCSSQGTLEIFVEPILPQAGLLVFGASPVALAIAPFAARVGFTVALACPGIGRVTLPDASEVIDGWGAPATIGRIDFIVVATQGAGDEAALAAAVALAPRHLALVASPRKAAMLKTGLLDAGCDPQQVEAIVSPAGVDIAAVGAEEIALAIVAGLVRARRQPATAAAPAAAVSVEAVAVAALAAPASCCSGGATR